MSALSEYVESGYHLARGLFPQGEVVALRDHYMALRAAGGYPGDTAGVDAAATDPLRRYPRMIHMHRWDAVSLQWMLDSRLMTCMAQVMGREPLAVQTMLYFKPPGARGQALHQDQFYLKAHPGPCIAAWMALDDCDEENGCLQVVPGSHQQPVLCPQAADTSVSFTDVTVELPASVAVRPVPMKAGDVLFFHGQLIHGSYPNSSRERFRRALIGHYVAAEATAVARFYHPVLRADGTEAALAVNDDGGPCGAWTPAQPDAGRLRDTLG